MSRISFGLRIFALSAGMMFTGMMFSPAAVHAQDKQELEAPPASWVAPYTTARYALGAGELEDAIAGFTEAIAIAPRRGEFYYFRGAAYQLAGEYALAIEDLTQALRLQPTASPERRADILYRRSLAHRQLQDFDAMMVDVADAVRLSPSVLDMVGSNAATTDESYTAAVEELTGVVENNPDDMVALKLRAQAYYRLEDWQNVVADTSVLLENDPGDELSRQFRADALLELENFPQAVADYDVLIEAGIAPALHLNSRCWARALWGRELDQALADCTASIEIMRIAANLDSRGLVHLRRGDYEAAIADYSEALEINDSLPESRFGRGIAYLRTGETDQGEADLAQAEELQPGIAEEFAGYGITP